MPGVGDVDAVGENRYADGAHLDDRRAVHGLQDLQVVDHQVENDVHVETARRERAQALDFDEARAGAGIEQRLDGRVVELDMPHGKDPVMGLGGGDQGVGLRQGRGDRLLHQQVHAAFEQRQPEFPVECRRRCEHRGVDLPGQFVEARGDLGAVLRRDRRGHFGPGVEDPFERHAREGREDPGVVAAEGANPENTHPQRPDDSRLSRHRCPQLRGGSAAP